MNDIENILNSLDSYFESASKEEIKTDTNFINELGKNGISLENYLENLNDLTSMSLSTIGVCDDIAYSDFFNKTISEVTMGAVGRIEMSKPSIMLAPNIDMSVKFTGLNNFATAA